MDAGLPRRIIKARQPSVGRRSCKLRLPLTRRPAAAGDAAADERAGRAEAAPRGRLCAPSADAAPPPPPAPPVACAAPGISASPSEENLRYFNVMILGPSASPYEGAWLRLRF